jgi:hypothetical protein
MKRSIPVADKENFLRENFHLASMAFDAEDVGVKKKLLDKIIDTFGYSPKTYGPDIERSFRRIFVNIQIERSGEKK